MKLHIAHTELRIKKGTLELLSIQISNLETDQKRLASISGKVKSYKVSIYLSMAEYALRGKTPTFQKYCRMLQNTFPPQRGRGSAAQGRPCPKTGRLISQAFRIGRMYFRNLSPPFHLSIRSGRHMMSALKHLIELGVLLEAARESHLLD